MTRQARNGITKVEVLVVFIIIVLGIGLLMPATRRVGGASARSSCTNNLKQIGLALQNYYDTHGPTRPQSVDSTLEAKEDGSYPPGCFGSGNAPEKRLSWMVEILPFIEQDQLYNQFESEKGYDGNTAVAQARIKQFFCPSAKVTDLNAAVTNYVAMAGVGIDAAKRPAGATGNGFMGYDRRTTNAMIQDGLGNTITIMETNVDLGPWARGGRSSLRGFDPANVPTIGPGRPFGGLHSGGAVSLFADGTVRIINNSIDPKKLAAMITIAGGESFDFD